MSDFDYRLALACGTDIPFTAGQVTIHQPTIKEVAMIGETDFFSGIQTLCLFKEMFVLGESVLDNVSNFQIFMTLMSQKETADKKYAVQQVFSIIFPSYNVIFLPQSITLSGKAGNGFIDADNFEELQEILRKMFGLDLNANDSQTFNPANEQAKIIADKIIEGRRRVAELKSQGTSSIFGQYMSILMVGLGWLSASAALDLTVFQVYDLIERYNLKLAWDIDLKAKLAGSTDKHQVENWMKDIH